MKKNTVLAFAVGFLVAGLMVYAAWQHNPQEEFYSEKAINWLGLSAIWFTWFLPVVILSLLAGCVLKRRRNR